MASSRNPYSCLYSWDSYEKIPRVRVEYYVNENTFKERLQLYFIKNQRSSLRIRICNLVFKLLTCVLYIVRVVIDENPINATCAGCNITDKLSIREAQNLTEEQFSEHPIINWDAIIWVDRPLELWLLHLLLAIVSLSEALILAYLGYKGNIWQQLLSYTFILDMVNTIPFVVTLFWPPLRNLFIPVFLNCWLAKFALENMFNDLHRAMQRSQSALSQQLTILSATLLCLVFTSVCGVQHFQRAGHRHLNLFQSTYFVVVTFSTVGYGDFVPDIWPSQLYMVIMICVALIVLPTQFEQLAFTWMERQKLGGSYSSHRAHSEKHVVVCSTTLHADTIMDFLNEFYAHPLLQDFYVVLLSPMELDTTMRMILQVPIWAQRVIYIQGSCLKDGDLTRARMNDAEACFILAARSYADKTAADEHTILRSWAVKDFAPSVPQYVQIFRPENKLHVKFAEHVVCEDEFKYALLANNCVCPGISTLVTLLLHTSRGQEGQMSHEEWHRLYGKCSGNEIYHIRLGDSRFFGEYEGKSFTYASFHSHRKYGVALVGVRPSQLPEFYEDTILLNPGPRHVMCKSDICFYMSITKEENSAFFSANTSQSTPDRDATSASAPHQQPPAQALSAPSMPLPALTTNRPTPEPSPLPIHSPAPPPSTSLLMAPTMANNLPPTSSSPGIPTRTEEAVAAMAANQLSVPSSVGGDSSPSPHFLSPEGLLGHRPSSRRPSILPVPDMCLDDDDTPEALLPCNLSEEDEVDDDVPWRPPSEKIPIVKGFPPVSPYIGVSPTLCYLLKEKKPLCCLQLAQVCEHCTFRSAKEYKWQNKTIIVAADYASTGIYNFVVPLRAHFRPKSSLNPIILLLERRPDIAFLDAIACFPLVYWMLGSIDCLDDLLRAGITLAANVVVVNKELSNSAEEDTLADCNTIVAVQTMFKFFPSIKIITELSQSSNMRFMQFRAHDKYALHLSKMEKREKERGSHISYMFRLPFAAGSVFSASMLDTLLYQAFVKPYLITFVRLLLGVDQAPGSGFLTSMRIQPEDMWIRTYGRLYQKLCSTTCEIPIGIYRTQDTSNAEVNERKERSSRPYSRFKLARFSRAVDALREESESEAGGGIAYNPRSDSTHCIGCYARHGSTVSLSLTEETRSSHVEMIERAEISNLVRSRMDSLSLAAMDYDDVSEKRSSLSYVIINPSCDLKLQEGDIIFLVRPSPFSAQKTFERHNSRRRSHISLCAEQRRRPSSASATSGGCRASLPSKANSLSLPESPSASALAASGLCGVARARSNSLRVDDILLRRSNSLRQGLAPPSSAHRRLSSFEELGLPLTAPLPLVLDPSPCGISNPLPPHSSSSSSSSPNSHSPPAAASVAPNGNGTPVKISLNGRIGLEVTPPDDPAATNTDTLQGTIV